ncbi:hypothetical protein VPHF86_0090 [Vibrio phage F86]
MTITKQEMTAIALDLMSGNNLMQRDLLAEGWVFGWSTRTAALGDCSYRDKEIRLSSKFLNARTKEEQINTITHEMAHAIAWTDFNERGHGAIWKRVHRQLGGNAERCSTVSNPEAVESKYTVFFINANDEIEVIQTTERMTRKFRPQNIKTLYLGRRKAETQGKIRCVATSTFKSIKADHEASKASKAAPVAAPAPKKVEKKAAPAKKTTARGEAARREIEAHVTATMGFSNVSFEQRGKYKDWYITATVNGNMFEQRLDAFKKKNGL